MEKRWQGREQPPLGGLSPCPILHNFLDEKFIVEK